MGTMKYYLLTFNEDWADEHNVPALACFTEEEYNSWLEELAGRLNKNYEDQKRAYDAQETRWMEFWKNLEEAGYSNTLEPEKGSPLNLEFIELSKNGYRLYEPNKVHSYMRAHLGNRGDGFEDSYNDIYMNREFLDCCVDTMEVPEVFYTIFHKARLAELSLCNIFESIKEKYCYDDDEEDKIIED